jgi:uncharacterized membrane protein YvbJ
VICPKCFSIQKDDGLRCHKCGAQLQTGVFRRPLPDIQADPVPEDRGARLSRRTSLVVMAVLAVSALALLLLLTALDGRA